MRIIREFRCSIGHATEELVDRATESISCPKCGATAQRIISPIRCKLDHTFPGEGMKWERMHERESKVQTSE